MSIEQERQQAQDENTAPEILAKLANSEDKITRQCVASNPNTPTEILLNLGAEFPQELLNNSIFDLLLLENSNLISEISITTLRSLIKQDDVPKSFIIECAERESDRDLLLGMTMNPKISRNVLNKLTQSKFSEVVDAAKLHINWSGEITEGWQELAEEKIKAIRPLYSGAATRIKRLQHEQPYLSVLAKFGWIPDFIILYWHKHWNRLAIFRSIANSTYTSATVLSKLGKSKNSSIKEIIAKNPNTPVLTLENLAEDNTEQNKLIDGAICNIKLGLSMNPNTSSNALEKLVQYDNCSFTIRNKIAQHPNCSIKILELLIEEDNVQVSHKVASNLNTPIFLLTKLVKKYDCRYNSIGKKSLELLKAKEAYLSDITHSSLKRVFICMSNNKQTVKEQWNYREKSNEQKNISLQNWEQNKFIEADLQKYIETDYLIVRLIVLLKDKTPGKLLRTKLSSLFWLERYAIAQNPNTPLYIIQKLTNDGNKVVRAAAKDNLKNKQINESATK